MNDPNDPKDKNNEKNNEDRERSPAERYGHLYDPDYESRWDYQPPEQQW